MRAVIGLVAVLLAPACAGTAADPGEDGGGAGAEPCRAAVKIGTGERDYAAVAAGQEVELVLPDPNEMQPAPGHIWVTPLVRGFDPDAPLLVSMRLLRADGTEYGRNQACIHALSDHGEARAGWWVITGLRAEVDPDAEPLEDLPDALKLQVTVDDGMTYEGLCKRVDPACTTSSEVEIRPVLPVAE